MTNTKKLFTPSLVNYNYIQIKTFTVTPRRYAEAGPIILAQYYTISPAFTLAVIFTSYAISIGGYLLTNLTTSASEAQHIEMFPDELEDVFFFIPDHITGEITRYLINIRNAVNFWNNVDHFMYFTREQAREMRDQLITIDELLRNIRQQCVYITDLDDTIINANLEFVLRYIQQIDQILWKIYDIQAILNVTILSL